MASTKGGGAIRFLRWPKNNQLMKPDCVGRQFVILSDYGRSGIITQIRMRSGQEKQAKGVSFLPSN